MYYPIEAQCCGSRLPCGLCMVTRQPCYYSVQQTTPVYATKDVGTAGTITGLGITDTVPNVGSGKTSAHCMKTCGTDTTGTHSEARHD